MPVVGETISASNINIFSGGKGANQAVAIRRCGPEVQMIGCVGRDIFGSKLLKSLNRAGVNTHNVKELKNSSTGTAVIVVEDNGDNRIIIVPGTNASISPEFINSLWPNILKSDMVILQHEIPLETVNYIIDKAFKSGIQTVLNPAPYYPIHSNILEKVGILIANKTEASAISKVEIYDKETAITAARIIKGKGVEVVIVTLGELGSVLVNNGGVIFQSAFEVDVVDTTGAGDTFVGAYSAAILKENSIAEALLYATAAAGLAVTKLGAQPSIPSHEEIQEFLYKNGNGKQENFN